MEEQEDKRPRAALINREWFVAARRVLPADQLGRVLMAAVEYVIEDVISDKLSPDERIVFEMARPWLDSDISAYRARCERNSRNARSQSQRVAASGSESQRVAANTTPTPTPTPTTTPTLSREVEGGKEIEREKWLIYGYFWSTGSKAIKEELNAFWSYYESLGWKNNKGAAIVSKLAAARMWRRQFENGTAPNGSDTWYKVVQSCPVADYRLWVGYLGAERVEDRVEVRLRLTTAYLEKLAKILPEVSRDLSRLWGAQRVDLKGLIS